MCRIRQEVWKNSDITFLGTLLHWEYIIELREEVIKEDCCPPSSQPVPVSGGDSQEQRSLKSWLVINSKACSDLPHIFHALSLPHTCTVLSGHFVTIFY